MEDCSLFDTKGALIRHANESMDAFVECIGVNFDAYYIDARWHDRARLCAIPFVVRPVTVRALIC